MPSTAVINLLSCCELEVCPSRVLKRSLLLEGQLSGRAGDICWTVLELFSSPPRLERLSWWLELSCCVDTPEPPPMAAVAEAIFAVVAEPVIAEPVVETVAEAVLSETAVVEIVVAVVALVTEAVVIAAVVVSCRGDAAAGSGSL